MTRLTEIWDRWCEQAAQKAGITRGELDRRLKCDEGALRLTAIIDTKEHSDANGRAN